ncbi:MAG: putative repeat protein [Thermoleophilia bacterium]|nr:putative repeat protein [Thermoleophilia bacterium]
MHHTPNRAHRRCALRASFLLATIFAIAAACAGSAGAATIAPNYAASPLAYANGTPLTSCRSWSGDADDAGHSYAACPVMRDTNGDGRGDVGTPALYEFDGTGHVVAIGYLPSEYYFDDTYRMRDVAVTPDGRTAYVSVGPLIDDLGQHPENNYGTGQPMANGARSGAVLRMVRQANGGWAYDPSWHAGPFLIGDHFWAARYLDVDAAGRVYVAVNAYVYELSPTTGAIVSDFGGATTDGPNGRWIDGVDVAQGIAVAADGGSLYLVEQKYHLVQRWLRVGATDWTRDRGFLLGVPGEEADGLCATNDHFQSPYDVGVDGAGDVYVADVTCNRIQRFTKSGSFVQTVWNSYGEGDLNHGFSVDWRGSINLPERELHLSRLDPASRPAGGGGPIGVPGCHDAAAPVLTGATAPARTSTRAVTVSATASDDCSGVAQVRITGPRAGAASWTNGSSATVSLTGWNGRHVLHVQVRDGAGHVSTRVAVVSVALALPQPPLVSRTSVAIAGRGCSAVPPLRRVAAPTRYRLVDRCARLTGRVVRSTRSGTGSVLQVLLPTPAARAIYANAVGPVLIWVVTDRRTRTVRAARVGHSVTFVGSLVALRTGRETYAVPIDVVSGT